MLACHVVLLTSRISLRLGQLRICKYDEQYRFHSPYTLPSSVSCESFAYHSCENCRVCDQQFQVRNSPLSTRHCIQLLSFHTLAHSCAFFCTLLHSAKTQLF